MRTVAIPVLQTLLVTFHSRAALRLEILALRQQLAVLRVLEGPEGTTGLDDAKYKCPVLSKVEMSYPVILYPWAARAIRPAELQPGSASSPAA